MNHTDPNALSAKAMRHQVALLEQLGRELPPDQQVVFETRHYLNGGVYGRELFIPAGSWLVGAEHAQDTLNVVIGDITVTTDTGVRRITGYQTLPSAAGTKRAGFAHADTFWITFARTDETDLEAIEDGLTPESDKLQTRQVALPGFNTPVIGEN